MRHILLLTFAAAAMVPPSAASAGDHTMSVRVSHADLNLATAAGREKLERRVATAVKRVCPSHFSRDLLTQRIARKCASDTRASLKPIMASLLNRQGVALASATQDNTSTVE